MVTNAADDNAILTQRLTHEDHASKKSENSAEIRAKTINLMEDDEYEEALKILEQLYQSMKSAFGEHDEETLAIKMDVGRCYYQMFNFTKAKEIFQDVVEWMEKVIGKKSPKTLRAKFFLAKCLEEDVDEMPKALEMFQEILPLQITFLGKDHLDVYETKESMGILLGLQMKYKESLDIYCDTLLPKQIKEFGDTDEKTLVMKTIMAGMFCLTGQNQLAMVIYMEIYNAQKILFGEGHPDTKLTLGRILQINPNWVPDI